MMTRNVVQAADAAVNWMTIRGLDFSAITPPLTLIRMLKYVFHFKMYFLI
jgi:hypothetical protein